MEFKAVVFDLFGTLVPPVRAPRFESTLEQMGVLVGVDPEFFKNQWMYDTWMDRATGVFATTADNILHVCREAGVDPSDEALAEAVALRMAFAREVLEPRPDAVATLERIKNAGLGMALVSVCSAEVPQLWPETSFAPYFDTLVYSCVAGLMKPDPRLFEMACDGLGVKLEESAYVADGFKDELKGAAGVGMHAILIAPPGEAEYGLGHRGEAATWTGPRVEALSEVLGLLGIA